MPAHKIEAQNLQKSYKSRDVVKDVSLTVKSGEIVGLLGPNGAGKTTTFYMIVGLVLSDGGHITFDNQSIERLSIDKRAKLGIGYLPQEASVFRKLSVEDNINIALEVRQDLNHIQRHEKLESLLDEFNLHHVRNSLGIALSGGERRRVEIARALAIDPAFILLDEPFAGVDPISVADIQTIISDLAARNIGVLITDHNVRETLGICERAYILGEGRILASGNPDDILANEKVKQVYLGEGFSL